MNGPPGGKEEGPDLLTQEGASGISELPGRVERYADAKNRALEISKFIETQEGGKALSSKVGHCGEYLLFREYWTIDRVKLHAAHFCKKHMLCQLCAIRRGAKSMQAYTPRYDHVIASNARLRPFLVTLTVKNGPDLLERFEHLQKSLQELWHRKRRGRGSVLDGVEAAVWSYEIKLGSGSGLWHPHVHMLCVAESMVLEEKGDLGPLSDEWKQITGDSFMVNVRAIDNPTGGFFEVFKYALKFSDMEPCDTYAAYQVLKCRRLIGSAGAFRGIEVPDNLLDEPFDDLPFVELFYRFMRGGYSLRRGQGQGPTSAERPKDKKAKRPPASHRAGNHQSGDGFKLQTFDLQDGNFVFGPFPNRV